jgi:hypothetical protein
MKAFIFVALVASVAARGLDLDTLRLLKEKSLLHSLPVVDELLLKEKLTHELPLEKTVYNKGYPVEDKTYLEGFKGIYDYDYENVDRVLTFEELYNTELFREYLRLPIFRQYIQYPAFQRYVASTYFQKFWQIPTFKTYFYNPVLFYKYIQPLVQLFHSEYSFPTNYYGHQDNVYSQDVFGRQELSDDVYYRNRNVFPYAYNNRHSYPTTTRFAGQYTPYTPYTTGTTDYKFLLDKVYRHLFTNQPVVGELTQVKTDVKTLIGDKKFVVEPITGERKVIVEEPKIIDVKVEQKIVPVEKIISLESLEHTTYEKKNVDDVLLLNVLLKRNVITPEIFETVIRGHVDLFTILRQVYGKYFDDISEVTDRDHLLVKILLHKNIITPEVYQAVIHHQINLHHIIRQIYAQYTDFHTVTEREVLLIKVLLKKHVITPEIFESVIRGHVDLYTILRQIYGKYVDLTDVTNRDVLLVKVLLKENVITPEIYEAVLRHQVDLVTVLRHVYGQYVENYSYDYVNRRDVDDFTFPTVNRFDRFAGNDRYNFDKMYKYNNWYNNQEYPTFRKNIFERLPLNKILGNIVA